MVNKYLGVDKNDVINYAIQCFVEVLHINSITSRLCYGGLLPTQNKILQSFKCWTNDASYVTPKNLAANKIKTVLVNHE